MRSSTLLHAASPELLETYNLLPWVHKENHKLLERITQKKLRLLLPMQKKNLEKEHFLCKIQVPRHPNE